MERIRIKVIGILSVKKALLFKSVLDLKKEESVLLCSFSEFDIPIGYEFNSIEDMNGIRIFSDKIVLEKVSQGFVKPFYMIPKGHKTVCKFSLSDICIGILKSVLPIVNDWYDSDVYVVLK